MTKRDRKAFREYVRWVADDMGLRDWTFEIEYRCDNEDAHATVYPVDGRKLATIKFEEGFRRLKPETQRMVVVHELVHCHLAALQHQLETDFEALLGKPADALMNRSADRNLEYAVDGLAHAINRQAPTAD